MTCIFGIKNCDTIKKAITWLDIHGILFEFVDYKKEGVVVTHLPHWKTAVGWKALLNTRGLMWKKLSEDERTDMTEVKASQLMIQYPSLIKRPVLVHEDQVIVGFDPNTYETLFKA